jgi:hypothetical protein
VRAGSGLAGTAAYSVLHCATTLLMMVGCCGVPQTRGCRAGRLGHDAGRCERSINPPGPRLHNRHTPGRNLSPSRSSNRAVRRRCRTRHARNRRLRTG